MGDAVARRIAIAALGLLALSGCVGSQSSQNAQPNPDPTGELRYAGSAFSVLAPADEAHSVSFGSLELCATGELTVTTIKPVESHGDLAVVGWGHRPNPFAHGGTMLGAEPQSLVSLGFAATPVTLPSGCGAPEGTNPEFAVQVNRPVPGAAAWLVGLDIGYTVNDGQTKHLIVPWTLGYCGHLPSGAAALSNCSVSASST